MVVPKTGGRPTAFTRVTTFIDCIEDKSSITEWKNRMVLIGAVLGFSADLEDEVRELSRALKDGTDEEVRTAKVKLARIVERCLDRAGANDKSAKGTHLHGLSELIDQSKPLPDGLSTADYLDMAAYAVATIDMKMWLIEQFTVQSHLQVGGTPDRGLYIETDHGPDGKPFADNVIGDLKTGTVEYGGLKIASQLAVYSRSEVCDMTVFDPPPYAKKVNKKDDEEGFEAWKRWDQWCKTEFPADKAATAYSPLPRQVNQDWGVVINLPAGTGRAELYWADLNVGWKAAKLATTIREMRSLSKKALRSFNTATLSGIVRP